MARGFAKGLFQGAILCGAALAALSLALPMSDSVTPVESATRPATDAATGSGSGPAAASMELPVGSEFARADDMEPVSPAPLTRPEMAGLGDAAQVTAPSDESAPQLATATAGRPDTAIEAPGAPIALSPLRESLDLPNPPQDEAPIPVAPPGRVVTPALDRMPEAASREPDIAAVKPAATPAVAAPDTAPAAAEEAPTTDTPATAPPIASLPDQPPAPPQLAERPAAPATTAQPQADRAPETVRPASAPALGAPVAGDPAATRPSAPRPSAPAAVVGAPLNLSTPPDLSGLGLSPLH